MNREIDLISSTVTCVSIEHERYKLFSLLAARFLLHLRENVRNLSMFWLESAEKLQ